MVRNALWLFVRLGLTMGIMLYASRVILRELGEVDFGLFSLVWGLASSFIFFVNAFSSATQRYLAYALGRGDLQLMQRVFSLSLGINLVAGLLAMLLGEAIGLYLIYHHLDIPPDRLDATLWVFHISVLSLIVQLLSRVYDSVLIAREALGIYGWLGILESGAKLGIIYLLSTLPYDKLQVYSLLFVLAFVVSRFLPIILYTRRYPECRYRPTFDRELLSELIRLMGWNGVSTAVWSVCNQGSDLMLNIFFGPVVNAARGISAQISSAVSGFGANFFTAIQSQITQSYAVGDLRYFRQLVYSSSRYGFYLLWLISLPLILRMDYILGLWLGQVPPTTPALSTWVLIGLTIDVLHLPLWHGAQATGRIRTFILTGSAISLLALPISYWGLSGGAEAVFALQTLAVVRLGFVFGCFWSLRREVGLPWGDYLRSVMRPVVLVATLSGGLAWLSNSVIAESFWGLIISTALTLTIGISCIALLGLSRHEHQTIRRQLHRLTRRIA